MPPEPPGGGARFALCLITDRKRLAESLNLVGTGWRDALLEQIRGALDGGIDVVQIRERGLDDRVLTSLVRDAMRLARGGTGRIVVNDRVDVAIASGADGVHLREDGLEPPAARELAARLFVGRSVHTAESAARSAGAHYLIAGPVFETASKPGHPGIGLDGFAGIAEAAPCPVWAVGGVAAVHASALARVGAGGTPWTALLVVGAVSMVLAATGTFERLLAFAIQLVLLTDGFMVLVLFRLRRRAPEAPFRVPLYPWVPAAFLALYAALFVVAARAQPVLAAVTLGILAVAYAAGAVTVRRSPR